MNNRYWNELSHNEQSKIENEWCNSDWYKNTKEESKSIKSNSLRYTMIIIIIIALVFTFLILTEIIDYTVFYFACGVFVFILLIMALISFVNTNNARYDYLEEEMKKWLLKNYNIIKYDTKTVSYIFLCTIFLMIVSHKLIHYLYLMLLTLIVLSSNDTVIVSVLSNI